nr:protein FAM135B-like isoform X1 [Ipomoea batatas]
MKSNSKSLSNHRNSQSMLDAVYEIAIYIHRFHNLDLFQQGWYQIKITMRWEDGEYESVGTPSRVVQYEAPDTGSDNICGVWMIDDTDNSYFTQPFRIKYARQDILLSVLVSFNLSLSKYEVLQMSHSSAVILKFELLYAPILENGCNLQPSLDTYPAAVHEFRLPPKALLGLHSYCPVHFDAFHAVLVDASVHICLLKRGVHTLSSKAASGSCSGDASSEDFDKAKQVLLIKGFLTARDILLEELRKVSKAINQAIDVNDFSSKHEDKELFTSRQSTSSTDNAEVSGQMPSQKQSVPQKRNGLTDFRNEEVLHSLSKDELVGLFHSFGNQVFYLWSIFLKFHRAHRTLILDFLRNQWAIDRRAEWSIWMVYSKVEMPNQYISSEVDSSTFHGTAGRAPIFRKLTEDPAQTAAMRAELHRRSIAQMRINNCSIQDMQIFGDPSRIPIVIVEHVNAPLRPTSGNSYLSHLEQKDADILLPVMVDSKAIKKSSDACPQQNGRSLKIVVFVHGFQGHHLDLRLVRNQWLLIDPKIEFLMSEANEEKTSGDFREMGLRLAQEVTSFVKKKMDKATRHGNLKSIKISFVGHSIGNIILRTALTESIMEPYLRYLHTYVSISGPHLGFLYSSNSLFNSGLWLLKKLKGTQCIHQLTFTDDPDIQNTFLYKLCKRKTLENFRNIILLSSPQDGYVPYHSARIEMCQASSADSSKKGKVFMEMLNHCLDQIRSPSHDHRVFMRCDVNFDTSLQGRNLNTMIGRAAHIEFLESDTFVKFIMWSFPEVFR